MKSKQKKQAEKTNGRNQLAKTIENKQKIIDYLTVNGTCKATDIAEKISLSPARTRALILELTEEGKIQAEGNGRSRLYMINLTIRR